MLERDRARLSLHLSLSGPAVSGLHLLNPSYQCVLLHRLSHHYYRNGHRLLARLCWHINLILTGADISPISQIGPGLVVIHPMSTLLFGQAGVDCTFWGNGGIGGGRGDQDIGAGSGLPIVGDRVVFGARAMVLGPIRIGSDTRIGAGCIVTRDVPPGSHVELGGRQVAVRSQGETAGPSRDDAARPPAPL